MKPILVFLPLVSFSFAWELGFYSEGEDWLPWDSSCKECTNNTSWSTCEDFMYIDQPTRLCKHWPHGEYYDFSTSSWLPWGGSCTGFWGYQGFCFQCSGSEMLDLESMQWVPSWNTTQATIGDNIVYNINGFCRTLDFFVDPRSDKQFEFGTREYPYRTIKPVFVEILKHYSHSEKEISIYLKEGSQIYMEDSQAIILNITLVKLSTYSDSAVPPGMAKLITTDLSIAGLSSKAAFHIMRNSTLDKSAIEIGNFTESELILIGKTGSNIEVVRSSFTIENIIARRQAAKPDAGVFIYLIYLQDKDFRWSKLFFNEFS